MPGRQVIPWQIHEHMHPSPLCFLFGQGCYLFQGWNPSILLKTSWQDENLNWGIHKNISFKFFFFCFVFWWVIFFIKYFIQYSYIYTYIYYDVFGSNPFPIPSPPPLSSSLLFLLNFMCFLNIQCCLYVHDFGNMYQSIGSLSVLTSLKNPDSPISYRSQ